MNSQGKVLLSAVKRCGFIAVLAGVMIFGHMTSAMAATPMEMYLNSWKKVLLWKPTHSLSLTND